MSTLHHINKLISERRSYRSFNERIIPNQDLILLFEAARWAPSAMNEQPWRYIVLKREDTIFKQLVECLIGRNPLWASKASHLIVTLSSKIYTHNQKPNIYAGYDLGQAIAFITIQAMELGIVIHQMGGFNLSKTKQLLEVPDDYDIVTVIAAGYRGDKGQLPLELQEMETITRTRKPLDQIVFTNKWEGEKLSLLPD